MAIKAKGKVTAKERESGKVNVGTAENQDTGPTSARIRQRKAKGKGTGKAAGSKSGNHASILSVD